MPPVITNLAPVTETEAVNVMLRQIGEQPVQDATTSELADVVMAVDVLRETTRESLSEGYRFNTEWGLRVNASATFTWSDPDGSTKSIRIFRPPTGLCSFQLSQTYEQRVADLDLELRISKQYTTGAPPVAVTVFYDRVSNRDGLEASKFSYIHIDPIWFMDFETLPQEMRRYITIRAARNFCEVVPGNEKQSKFTSNDELVALRAVKRKYGLIQHLNQFRTAEMQRNIGIPGRRLGPSGLLDRRNNP